MRKLQTSFNVLQVTTTIGSFYASKMLSVQVPLIHKRQCKLTPPAPHQPIRRARRRDTGNRDDCGVMTLFLFSSSPSIHPCRHRSPPLSRFHSPHFLSSLRSLSLPVSLSSYNFRTSSFPFSSHPSRSVCVWILPPPSTLLRHFASLHLPPRLSRSVLAVLFLFSCKECPVSLLPHQ